MKRGKILTPTQLELIRKKTFAVDAREKRTVESAIKDCKSLLLHIENTTGIEKSGSYSFNKTVMPSGRENGELRPRW